MSLIEILMGIVLIAVIAIATLTYFAYGLGGIGKQGNRRAALERARERLEQLMAVNVNAITPNPVDFGSHTATCNKVTGACALSNNAETVAVEDLLTQKILSTVQCVHDATAGTQAGTCDVLELSAKVWFIPNTNVDDNYNRVYVKTLRTP